MAKRGGGAIVNLSSVGGGHAFRASIPYVTSKGAIESLTQGLAMDLAPYHIRVNAIGPGMIRTPGGWSGVSEEEVARRRRTVPLGREGFPQDIAGVTAFLLSDDASYVTGQTLYVDGGLLTPTYSTSAEIPYLVGEPPQTFELADDA
jgi:NAD(P)-dependent dehydrogenase (short-subunit alcohol dehydrogenase family)